MPFQRAKVKSAREKRLKRYWPFAQELYYVNVNPTDSAGKKARFLKGNRLVGRKLTEEGKSSYRLTPHGKIEHYSLFGVAKNWKEMNEKEKDRMTQTIVDAFMEYYGGPTGIKAFAKGEVNKKSIVYRIIEFRSQFDLVIASRFKQLMEGKLRVPKNMTEQQFMDRLENVDSVMKGVAERIEGGN